MAMTESIPAPLTLTLFGPLEVLVSGRPLPRLRSRKALWLLVLLALRHGRPVAREWLAGILWPDADRDQAYASLRVVLSELRKALGDAGGRLQSPDRHLLSLDLSGAEVDVVAFDAAIAQGEPAALARAVALYRGPLLEGCVEEWAPQERRVHEEDCLRALQTLADSAFAAGDYAAAVRYCRRAVELDPWREAARRSLMEALSKGGDTNAALLVYREFVALLRGDPQAMPDRQTRALYERLRAEARRQSSRVSAAAQAEPRPSMISGYLPHPLTDLIGREEECQEVASRLRRSRLVTLMGTGGIGKTRLALAVASDVAQEYPDGVWLVALEALTEGMQVARQVMGVLGLTEEVGRTALTTLTGHLRPKRLLLVLDNCEHLLEACSRVVEELLRECMGVRILTTSREALGIVGEVAWRIPSLETPDLAHLPKGKETLPRVLIGYESIQLFVERAQAVQKDFALTSGNAFAVAHICAHLEGIPLAIELAAARIRVMTAEQLAARLNDHMGLLKPGSRPALTRRQTLRATLDWSYELLAEPERLLLRRLSVFAEGWTLEAAETVCGGDGLQPGQVLDLLTSLLDKSLAVFEERRDEGRYRLLEMVRQYAAERLETEKRETGSEAAPIRARHRDYYLALAQAAEPELKGPSQQHWLHRLETEIANLRAALAWCRVETDGGTAGLHLAGALWQFWELRGYYNEGRTSLSEALGRTGAGERDANRAKSLYAAGVLAFYQGDYPVAKTLYEEGLAIFRELGTKQGIARSLKDLGRVAGAKGDYKTARALYAESLTISQELGDKQGSGWTLNDLGNVTSTEGDYDRARTLHEQSLEISRELGDTEGIAWCLHHLGGVASAQGNHSVAQECHEESLAIFRTLGNTQGEAWTLNYLGNVHREQGAYQEAQVLYEEGLAIFRTLGNKQGTAWTLHDMGKMEYTRGSFAAARALQKESIRIQRDLGDKRGVGACLRALAALTPGTIRQVAYLWGAAEALRESIGARLSQSEQALCDRQVAQARAALGADIFAAAWKEGRGLTMEQAAAYALEEVE